LSIEEAGSEKKICSAILLFIYSIEGAPERSRVEKRWTAVPPLPQSGRQEKREMFFQSQPPQRSTVTCFGHEKRIIFSQQKCTILNG
jgi:hypothetical protein